MKLILLGAPGSGKGTMAERIKKDYGIVSISTGDIIRENIKNETELGSFFQSFIDKGLLVPDELIVELVKDRLNKDDVKHGYILDGFPRTISQAKSLDLFEDIDKVILIDTNFETIKDRILSRMSCPVCKAIYNTKTYKGEFCENCGEKLVVRSDDNEQTLKERYSVYQEQTQPLISYYEKQNKLLSVDGNGPIDAVYSKINDILKEG